MLRSFHQSPSACRRRLLQASKMQSATVARIRAIDSPVTRPALALQSARLTCPFLKCSLWRSVWALAYPFARSIE